MLADTNKHSCEGRQKRFHKYVLRRIVSYRFTLLRLGLNSREWLQKTGITRESFFLKIVFRRNYTLSLALLEAFHCNRSNHSYKSQQMMNITNNYSADDDAEKSAQNPSATGTRANIPISLLDDDDDDYENDSEKLPLETRSAPKTPREESILDVDEERSRKKAKFATVDGCMLTPQIPIKLFATDRDKGVRRRLRRKMKANATSEIKEDDHDNYRNHWSNLHCWTFREMLGLDRFSGVSENSNTANSFGIDWIFITTYILDLDFLLTELPELADIKIVVVVYQYKDESISGREEHWKQQAKNKGFRVILLCRDPRAMPQSSTNPLQHTMDYGCHHTKMVLMGYSSGRLRVNIHTSNLRREDIHDKCQGAFLQDFLPKTEDQLCAFESSAFEESLVTYLESYHFLELLDWETDTAETLVSHLQTYDFSKAVGILVPSIPGYHTKISMENDNQLYGYLKVQQAIRDHCTRGENNPGSIVCQFSSMGSLSRPYLNKIADAWNVASAGVALRKKKSYKPGEQQSYSFLKIVWPTMQEIVASVEGARGGASVPGRSKNLNKDFLRPLLHRWKSEKDDEDDDEDDDDLQHLKGNHVPHIKSYYQQANNDANANDTNTNDMHWFVLSSHNLSKAAWGELQNRRDYTSRNGDTIETLVIQHWELGIFLSPSTLGVHAMGAMDRSYKPNAGRAVIPLPYQFQPNKYKTTDQPWVVE